MSAYTSKHIIEFEHLYKKGQTVWIANDPVECAKVEIVEFDPESRSVSYFVKELGWFEECCLFASKKEAEDIIRNNTLEEIRQAENLVASYKNIIDRENKKIQKLKSSPWLAKETNREK